MSQRATNPLEMKSVDKHIYHNQLASKVKENLPYMYIYLHLMYPYTPTSLSPQVNIDLHPVSPPRS